MYIFSISFHIRSFYSLIFWISVNVKIKAQITKNFIPQFLYFYTQSSSAVCYLFSIRMYACVQ